ncbi:hypothetical protein [Streptomyces sp. NPDC001137]|uniref:hypothetical protein n=1 Tax=Streptomyces sp. NPDC001137 TaxID=3154378 RepID=UPI00332FACC2
MPRLYLRQPVRALRGCAARPHVLFGGLYGAVLASSIAARRGPGVVANALIK